MRELKAVGLDIDGKRIVCEAHDSGEMFILLADDRLRAAVAARRPAESNSHPTPRFQACCVPRRFKPRFVRALPSSRSQKRPESTFPGWERFAHPVLLERSRAAELATAAHPVLADGPSVLTLLETVTAALIARGLTPMPPTGTPGATRTAAGRCSWLGKRAGRTKSAHFRSSPARAAHRRRVRRLCYALDRSGLRAAVAPGGRVPQLDFEELAPPPVAAPAPSVAAPEPEPPEAPPKQPTGAQG